METAVEMDDAAMEAYLEGKEPDEATLRNVFVKEQLIGNLFLFWPDLLLKIKGFSLYWMLLLIIYHLLWMFHLLKV